MKLVPLCFAVCSLYFLACHNIEPKPAPAPISAPAPAPAPAPAAATPQLESEPKADLQTLTENHNILVIRVAGNTSKLSAETKAKITPQTTTFNTAFEKLKTDLKKEDEAREALKTYKENQSKDADAKVQIEKLTAALVAADAASTKSMEAYEEAARTFAQLIQEVRKERGF